MALSGSHFTLKLRQPLSYPDMNIETLREYCLSKQGEEETLPFGPDTLVYKVGGKMFLLTGLDSEDLRFNVKCDPDKAIEWREVFTCVVTNDCGCRGVECCAFLSFPPPPGSLQTVHAPDFHALCARVDDRWSSAHACRPG